MYTRHEYAKFGNEMATPTRQRLRKIFNKRLEKEGENAKGRDEALEELSKKICSVYSLLESRILFSESATKHNFVEPLLEVSMKTKEYDTNAGPVDAVRVIFNNNLVFKVYVFYDLTEDGTLFHSDDVENLAILRKMNDTSF